MAQGDFAGSYSPADIRARNLRLVLKVAAAKKEMLRSDISQMTGMTSPTVMKVVQLLVARGLLCEAGAKSTRMGRRPTLLKYAPGGALGIGILLEGRELRAGLADMAGNLVFHTRIPCPSRMDEELQALLLSQIAVLLQKADAPVLGVGLGIPGVVSRQRNVIEFAPLIGITSPYDCGGLMRRITDACRLPVCLENDVNCAAMGEALLHVPQSPEDLLFISLGTGIGAGIMLNGSLRRGARNLAGELGYAVSGSEFETRKNAPGQLESKIGWDAMMARFPGAGQGLPDEAIAYLVENLAPPLANLTTQLDIEHIILGGLLVDAGGEGFIAALSEKLNRLTLSPCAVRKESHGGVGIAGAGYAAIDENLGDWLRSDGEDG